MDEIQLDGSNLEHMAVDVVQETPNLSIGLPETQSDDIQTNEVEQGHVDEEDVNIGAINTENRVRIARGRNRENWATEQPEIIRFNRYGQAVAPSKTVARYARYLGQKAIDQTLFPIDQLDWRGFRGRVLDRAWGKIEATIDWSDEGTRAMSQRIRWVAEEKMNERWKHHKCKLRKDWYKPFINTSQRFQCGDDHVNPSQWLRLVAYWDSHKGKKRSVVNSVNRGKLLVAHTSGTKSHAQVRDEYAQDHNGEEPNRIQLFKLTHRRADGKPIDQASREMMEEMDNMVAEYESMDSNPPITPAIYNRIFTDVAGPESGGRVKGYGLGVTPADIPGLVVNRRGVGMQLQELRLENERLLAEAARQVELQRQEMERNRRLMEQYMNEMERVRMINNQEILNIQRQNTQMDMNINGKLTTALDSYLRSSIGTNTVAEPLPPIQGDTNRQLQLDYSPSVVHSIAGQGQAAFCSMMQGHSMADIGMEDAVGASTSVHGRSGAN